MVAVTPFSFLQSFRKKKKDGEKPSFGGRGDWTRTSGILVPNQARYQTSPRLDS